MFKASVVPVRAKKAYVRSWGSSPLGGQSHVQAVLLLRILPEASGPIGNSTELNWKYDSSVDSMFVTNPELQNQDRHWYPFWMSDIWFQAATKHR